MKAIARNGNGMNAMLPASHAVASVADGGFSRSETSTEAPTKESVSNGPATTTSKTIALAWLRLIAAASINATVTPSASERQKRRP